MFLRTYWRDSGSKSRLQFHKMVFLMAEKFFNAVKYF